MVSSASSHLRAARQGTEIPKEHRQACYFHRKSHVRTLYPKPMPGKRMLDEERKDDCRNTGNLPKRGYQGMTCSWKKIKKVNNCAGRSHARKLWSSQGWRIGLWLWTWSQGGGGWEIIHVSVSSGEQFSVIFSYSILTSVWNYTLSVRFQMLLLMHLIRCSRCLVT